MVLVRTKPYKAIPPKLTIDKIRAIFVRLGFSYTEIRIPQNSSFVSYNLILINPENKKPIFSTNGKGSSSEWALASAWGEMAERIQNLAYFMIQLYPSCPEPGNVNSDSFKYFPDEKIIIQKKNNNKCKELFTVKNRLIDNSFIGVPFFNVLADKNEYLPFRVMQVVVGSNGMCSGNTREEALIQGISEIFERAVLKEFYLHPFCPPDIPLELFKNFEIYTKIVNLIKQNNYQVSVKDCSLGKNYPVIGVLIVNYRGEYAFHLGADPSPVTALERCFTEMYQGGNLCFKKIEESRENAPCDLSNEFWKQNFSKTISANAGYWPPELFKNTYDYTFTGFHHTRSISAKNDLNYLLRIVKKQGKKIYIRDNSFLGQPAYYCYIPGMSEITNIPDDSFSNTFLGFDYYISTLTNLGNSSLLQRKQLFGAIKKYITNSPIKNFRASDYFAYYHEHPIARLSVDKITELLNDSEDVGPKDFLKNLNLPSCFHCTKCDLKYECNFPFIKRSWEKIRTQMKLYYDKK